jgi:hypothetical protein
MKIRPEYNAKLASKYTNGGLVVVVLIKTILIEFNYPDDTYIWIPTPPPLIYKHN